MYIIGFFALSVISAPATGMLASPDHAFVEDSLPSCASTLDALEAKVRADYAGFGLEVRGKRLESFATMKRAAAKRAAHSTGDACFYVLRDFVDWFNDPHLFLVQTSRVDTAETRRRAANVETRNLTEEEARRYYRRMAGRLDPIEGIWYDRSLRVAIVRDSARGRGHFLGVILSSDTSIWRPGAVRARFTRLERGRYEAHVLGKNYALAHRKAEIYRHVLLRFSPGMWGKEFPVAAVDSGTLDSMDVHRPKLVRRGSTWVAEIPSNDPALKPVLDSIVGAHHDQIAHADRFIVDLRGNEGGASFMTDPVEPFIATKDQKPDPYPGTALMLSSDDQIAYARRAFGPDTSAFVRSLIVRLTAHPGALVPLSDPTAPAASPDPRNWVVTSGPHKVGVLVDGGTVSAAEVLVLAALRSNRATVFGEPTAGALDYQSANIVSLSTAETRWYLGYPTITRSASLPKNGMRGHGIAPNVWLDLSKTEDPIGYVDAYLARQDR